ncbi:MAG: hypothetical protein V7K27_13815 [Nostoc sp.]|uniref:hypothetical protein n=1 Tax=Nostoc sp. TaxID=1180 RepID=UPI002FFADE42
MHSVFKVLWRDRLWNKRKRSLFCDSSRQVTAAMDAIAGSTPLVRPKMSLHIIPIG